MKKIGLYAGMMAVFAMAGGIFAALGSNDMTAASAADGETAQTAPAACPGNCQAMSEDREAAFQAMEEKREAVRTALENQDYNAWLAAVGENSYIAEKVNQDNFQEFAEAHKLIFQGHDKLEAMGIDGKMGRGGCKMGKGMGMGMGRMGR